MYQSDEEIARNAETSSNSLHSPRSLALSSRLETTQIGEIPIAQSPPSLPRCYNSVYSPRVPTPYRLTPSFSLSAPSSHLRFPFLRFRILLKPPPLFVASNHLPPLPSFLPQSFVNTGLGKDYHLLFLHFYVRYHFKIIFLRF